MNRSIKFILKGFTALVLLTATSVMAAEATAIPLDKANNDLRDKASLQRGAALFTNYCFGCHQMQYQRYNRVAKDLGIPEKLMVDNLIFDNTKKFADLMTNSLTEKNAKLFFGAPVPDLTLDARIRGTDWIYTYLRSFYADPSRPFGVNNMLFPSVAMPHVLEGLQGLPTKQFVKKVVKVAGVDKQVDEFVGLLSDGKGSMSVKEYDDAVRDIVNFLAYSAEPIQLERQALGWWVLGYLFILLILTYLLKKAFWRSVPHRK